MPVPSSTEGLNKTPAVTFHASNRKRVLNGVVSAVANSPLFPRTPGTKTTGAGSVAINDDEAERRQRRLQNTMNAMMSPGCHTPKNVPKTPASRVNAVESSTSSLSNTQIAEHYANCIKLSSQNKISSKNAFGLHLIDHMLQLLKVRGEMKNFQVASSTLDAGAKIYAGRVDSIYNDIFKILTGMGTKEAAQGREEDGENPPNEEEGGEAPQPRKKNKSSTLSTAVVVEKNPKVLDMNTNSLEFAVDPLFKKTSAAFDEGGVDGLLFSHLFVMDESCSVVFETDAAPGTVCGVGDGIETDMEEISELLDPSALQELQIYNPSFSSFLYASDETPLSAFKTGTEVSTEGGSTVMSDGIQGNTDIDYSMLQCPPNVPDTTLFQDCNDDYDDDGMQDGGMDFDNFDATVLGVCKDNQMAQYITSGGKTSENGSGVPGDTQKERMDLFLMDAIEPSEYSYFKPAVVASWAGPQHWKIGARNIEKKAAGDQTAPKKRSTVQFRIDFNQVPDSSLLSSGKTSTKLSKTALAKMKSEQATLPRDPHATAITLHKLFCRPKWKVSRQCKPIESLDDGPSGAWYNYSNLNDNLNYCPVPDQDMDDDDDCFDGGGMESEGYLQNDTVFDYDKTSDVPLRDNDSQLLVGDRLVAQPKKVEKIQIDYARNAKKIDVKRLKLKIWEILNDDPPETTDDADQVDQPETNVTAFTTMFSTLPSKLPQTMTKNVSIPICFVCLLHLANEKSLEISGTDDLSNLHICTS